MSHFAKLNDDGIVIAVTVGRQEDDGREQELSDRTGDTYKQTSYNTWHGVHWNRETNEPSADQSKAFRKNYASIGFIYDEERDAFIPPKPFASWVLDEETCDWVAPKPYPEDGGSYIWSDHVEDWVLIP